LLFRVIFDADASFYASFAAKSSLSRLTEGVHGFAFASIESMSIDLEEHIRGVSRHGRDRHDIERERDHPRSLTLSMTGTAIRGYMSDASCTNVSTSVIERLRF